MTLSRKITIVLAVAVLGALLCRCALHKALSVWEHCGHSAAPRPALLPTTASRRGRAKVATSDTAGLGRAIEATRKPASRTSKKAAAKEGASATKAHNVVVAKPGPERGGASAQREKSRAKPNHAESSNEEDARRRLLAAS